MKVASTAPVADEAPTPTQGAGAGPSVDPGPVAAAPRASSTLSIAIVTADGVRPAASAAEVRDRVAAESFCWIDIAGGEAAASAPVLDELAIDPGDLAWMQRFSQAGRMSLNAHRLRAVTWFTPGLDQGLIEIHVLCVRKLIVTVWHGDPRTLDDIRRRLSENMARLEKSPFTAVAILMQLLLGTVHDAVREIDGRLQAFQGQLKTGAATLDFAAFEDEVQRLQSVWSDIDGYSSAVNTATIGVQALPGVDPRAASELNEYADQVEDLEHRLHVRSRWGQELLHDRASALAQRQSDQISRLTVVSVIFLPLTFLTGFFGMNFPWMVQFIRGFAPFLWLGVAAPILCLITAVWLLRRRGLL